jgi:DNA-binding SARP family transcriptional activator/tetratricopeptide (TPR) repeat protein
VSLSDAERENAVEIRVLGELNVSRKGVRVALPQSKKARALLGYLVLTGRSHRRERLARLLWDVADDSRGALRWTLSRVRAAVDGDGPSLIIADRDEVRFDRTSVTVDVLDLQELLASDIEQASIDALERAASLFRGELLEGCELPDFFDFTAWLAAERDQARKTQAKVLSALTTRLAEPERALPHARARVRVDPLDEAAGVALVRLLVRSGRRAEAEEHCESVARLLDRTGLPRAPLWPALRAELHTPRDVAASPPAAAVPPAPSLKGAAVSEQRGDTEIALVGRGSELAELLKAPERAAEAQRPALVLVTGDPGIGKSRLLAEAIGRFRQGGARVLSASAFEADRSLPFLPWMELFRALDPVTLGEGLREQLSPLLPATQEGGAAPSDRDRLFRAVTKLLSGAPLILFDDAQWLDDASTALLHHVLRALSRQPFVVVLAARRGELADNPALVSLLRGARRDRLLFEVELGPLSAEEVQALAREARATLDPARIVRESQGSPLMALELARWNGEQDDALPGTLREMVAERLDRLPRPALEALQWAVTLGSHFAVDALGELTGQHPEELLRCLDLLERHAFLRAAGTSGGYVFPHELVEKAIYLAISEPRRKLMHRRIAELFSASGREEILANDVSRHAALGGDSELAARACLRAAERSLRVFANDEARAFARRGLRHSAALDEARRVPLEIHLHCAAIYARRPSDVEGTVRTLLALGERALDFGHANDVRAAYRMVSFLRWEVARFDEAERASESLLAIGRAGNADERARAMAEAGLCLALLERDLPRAEALLLEARALSQRSAAELYAVSFGFGLLHRYRGEVEQAVQLFSEARNQARHRGERSAEFAAFAQIVEITYEGGDIEKAEREGEQLRQLGERLREGSEPAFARGLWAAIRYARGDLAALEELGRAVEELRTRDATHRLATILLFAAELDLARGDAERARERAQEARSLAAALERRNDVVVALVLVARAAFECGDDPKPSLQAIEALGAVDLSARARRALGLLAAGTSRSLQLEEPP